MAINYNDENRATCKKCTTCDTFACAIGAKNDLDTIIYKKNEENNFCAIGNVVRPILFELLQEAEQDLIEKLRKTTLANVIERVKMQMSEKSVCEINLNGWKKEKSQSFFKISGIGISNFSNILYKIKSFRYPNVYSKKGIFLRNELIQFKEGKKNFTL